MVQFTGLYIFSACIFKTVASLGFEGQNQFNYSEQLLIMPSCLCFRKSFYVDVLQNVVMTLDC